VSILFEIIPDLWVAQPLKSKEEESRNNESINQICSDIGTLLSISDDVEESDSKEFLDFTIKSFDSEGVEESLKAHKCILAGKVYCYNLIIHPKLAQIHTLESFNHVFFIWFIARSPVFKRMLENPQFNETKEATATISDVSAEALRHFLKFLYTGELNLNVESWEDNSKLIMELVYAADKVF